MNSSNDMTRAILSVLGLVIAGVVYFGYTQPAYSNIKTLKAEIAEYNQALDKAAELKKLKEALLSRFNTFDDESKDRLGKMLPNHVDNVRLILDLDSLATKFDIPFENVSISTEGGTESSSAGSATPGGSTPRGGAAVETSGSARSAAGTISADKQKYGSLTLKFSTRTTYDKFFTFLEALQSSLRLVDVVNLSVAADSSSSSSGERIYRYDITIRTYWLK